MPAAPEKQVQPRAVGGCCFGHSPTGLTGGMDTKDDASAQRSGCAEGRVPILPDITRTQN